jgi:hypothetical protein
LWLQRILSRRSGEFPHFTPASDDHAMPLASRKQTVSHGAFLTKSGNSANDPVADMAKPLQQMLDGERLPLPSMCVS